MRWSHEDNGEGDTYWSCRTPIGEICVEFADWLDSAKPWHVTWFPGSFNEGVVIAKATSQAQGKDEAERWLRTIEARIGNTLAAGYVPQDDGA